MEGETAANLGHIRHFEAIGHVAGETDVKNGGADAFVFDDVLDFRDERPRLPRERAAGL